MASARAYELRCSTRRAVLLMFNELAYAGNLGRNYRHPADHGFEQNVRDSVLVSVFRT